MVRHHVAQGAGAVVESAAGLDAYRLGRGDLHVVDVIAIPQRLENAVGKAQYKDVLDRLLAEEMVDPVSLVLAQDSTNLRIERARRGEVVTEGLLDDDAPPGAVRLVGQAGAAQLLDDGPEVFVGNRQVEQHVAISAFT